MHLSIPRDFVAATVPVRSHQGWVDEWHGLLHKELLFSALNLRYAKRHCTYRGQDFSHLNVYNIIIIVMTH